MEVKPCPKCNSDLINIQSSRRAGITQIICTDCGHFLSLPRPEDKTIPVWNKQYKQVQPHPPQRKEE